MIAQAREVPERSQGVQSGFRDPIASTTDHHLSHPTTDPNGLPVRDRIGWPRWQFTPYPRQVMGARRNLGLGRHGCRSVHLSEPASVLGPLPAESASITPYVFSRRPTSQQISVKENPEHLVKGEREHTVPGLR